MRAAKIITFIIATAVLIFSFLFILGAFGDQGQVWWLWVGLIGMVIGLILIFAGTRISSPQKAGDQNVTLNIDLPGNVKMDTIKCKSCGAPLAADDIKMVNGSPVVTCHHCNTTYQLTEEPKW